MIGNWKWNFFVALASGLLTFTLSWPKNPPLTTVSRSLFAFAVLYAAVYAVRWLWGFALGTDRRPGGQPADAEAGRNVDLTTPTDDKALLKEMLAKPAGGEPPADEFVPLQPEKLVSKDKLDPELMTRAVRQMSQD